MELSTVDSGLDYQLILCCLACVDNYVVSTLPLFALSSGRHRSIGEI